ncbi:MAG: hypothetical protein EBW74_11210, partial [Betaproteobacteria bacterium]|nr:hypothetical protein [Betaproteobacteria bacterium]
MGDLTKQSSAKPQISANLNQRVFAVKHVLERAGVLAESDIEAFRIKIDPFFIGRPKHEVAHELPPLTTKRIEAPLS